MPLVSRTFDQLIDFSRTSAATYVDATGKIVTTPASRNLITYTQEFDNGAWSKDNGGATNPVVTANQGVAPDGTMTADRIVLDKTGGTFSRIQQGPLVTASAIYTFSVWMRTFSGSGTANVGIRIASDGVNCVVTGAWQRFAVTMSVAAASQPGQIILFDSIPGNDETADVLVWGAQYELGTTASTYTRNVAGTFPPRFDYDPVTLAPKGLLVEEQRTNLLTYSEQFNNTGAWATSAGTVTANAITSPDGTTNADAFIADTANALHYLSSFFGSAVTTYTVSFYAKSAGYRLVVFTNNGGTNQARGFDLSNGTTFANTSGYAEPISSSITPVGNGWYRCSMTFNKTVAASCGIGIWLNDGASDTFAGNGTSGVYLYGAQLEAGAFATSYIPTVASQVTRTADNASIVAPNFAPWYNQSEGTILADVHFKSGSLTKDQLVFQVDNGTLNERNKISRYAGAFYGTTRTSGSISADIAIGTANAETIYKVVYAYKANDFAGTTNGAAVTTDNAGAVPASLSAANIGRAINDEYINGWIRSIRYYPTRLTNAQLQALTA